MQITDITRQYISANTSTESMNSTRGVENLVSSVRDLTAGNVFEGTVNAVSGGKVVIGLSNGRELTARLDASMQMVKGQSMFFQVKSNDGATIAIRPYMLDGAEVNLTLLNALKAANLPITDKNLTMANFMMQEQMPIDKNSMAQMARVIIANPDMSVNTLVQMKKFDIPITKEMAAQFENYVDDSNAIHKALDSFVTELPALCTEKQLSFEQLKSLDSDFLQILAEGLELPEESSVEVTFAGENLAEESFANDSFAGEILTEDASVTTKGLQEKAAQTKDTTENLPVSADLETVLEKQEPNISMEDPVKESLRQTINRVMGDQLIAQGDTPAIVLNKLSHRIANDGMVTKEMLLELFSSKEMQTFFKDVLEEQLYLKPQDVADGEKVKKLYERLQSKTQKMEDMLVNAQLKSNALAQTIADVHGNIDFMNQLNQTYTYVQIPLKMSGQNASGQLYVYTNKKDLGDPDRDLTAFLHLDLEHLGATDVSVRMHRKEVDTKFYMDSDEAYALVSAHMQELEERLQKKGFHAKIYVENEGKKVDFLGDFLRKDAPSTGQLHRYSFDVRA